MLLSSERPEIIRFDRDRYILSPAVGQHLSEFRSGYLSINRELERFLDVFSRTQVTDFRQTGLFDNIEWTFTSAQKSAFLEEFKRIGNRYPAPLKIQANAVQGLLLDLQNVTEEGRYMKQLNTFRDEIVKLRGPDPIEFTLDELGKFELKTIHDAIGGDFYDPVLGNRIGKVWTLDVSHSLGLSIKDIMAKRMLADALATGSIQRSTVIVEGTSGNTGAGLALAGLFYGMKVVLTITSKQSREKVERLRLLGAHVVITPTDVEPANPRSYYSVRDYLTDAFSGWNSSQYDNPSNGKAHEEYTGPLIWEKTKGEVTALVAPAGTCGTVSGVARYLKGKNPHIKVIAVDTIGSILYLLKEGYTLHEVQEYAKGYLLQGFGEDIHPKNLDLGVIDRFVRVGDRTGMQMARFLPALGCVSGQSSGASYAALVESVANGYIERGDKAFIMFPDTAFPYRKDMFNREWMRENGMI